MKTLKSILVLVSFLIITSVKAQDFQGEVTYKYHNKVDVKLDSISKALGLNLDGVSLSDVKKDFEKTYVLTFNEKASICKISEQDKEEKEETTRAVEDGLSYTTSYKFMDEGLVYKDINAGRFISQKEIDGKLFLIKEELIKSDWKLTGETKKIEGYTCYKATKIIKRKGIEISTITRDDSGQTLGEESTTTTGEELTVIAWYTTEIPLKSGPMLYHGLPGLILEVNNGGITITATKIILNPEKKINVIEPTKGEEITKEKYENLFKKVNKRKAKQRREERQFFGIPD